MILQDYLIKGIVNQCLFIVYNETLMNNSSQVSQQMLKSRINSKIINKITYHYTLCEKQGQTIGLISHKRILVLNQNDGTMYYVAQPEKDKDNLDQLISQPKKEVINFNLTVVKNEAKTKKLQVIYNKKSDKDKIVVGNWKFLMDSQPVAEQWANLVKDKKNQRTAKALGMSNVKQAGYLNDVVTFSMVSGPKQQEIKEKEIKKQNNMSNTKQPQVIESRMNKNSRLQPTDNKNVQKTNPIQNNPQTHSDPNPNPKKYQYMNRLENPVTVNESTTRRNNGSLIKQSRNQSLRNSSIQNKYPLQVRGYTALQDPKKSTVNDQLQVNQNPNKNSLDNKYQNNKNANTNNSIVDSNVNTNTNLNTNTNTNTTNTYNNTNTNNNTNTISNKPEIKETKNEVNYKNTEPSTIKNNPTTNSTYKKPEPPATEQKQIKNPPAYERRNPPPTQTYNNKPSYNKNEPTTYSNNKNQTSTVKKSPKNAPQQKNKQNPADWNHQFLVSHCEQTIKSYSDYSLQVFMSLPPSSISLRAPTESKDQEIQPKKVIKNGIRFFMAEIGTKSALQLKKQFNNYHYLLESCRQNKFINVPLCCLIQYLGILCLAKAEFPSDLDIVQNLSVNNGMNMAIIQQLRNLQLYTKISSQSIKRSTYILDLSRAYGTTDGLRRIYVDNLIDYLPTVPDHFSAFNEQVRPEIIYENFSKTINLRVPETQEQISKGIRQSINQLSDSFSEHQIIITSYQDLKQILHSYGLNTSLLPQIYAEVQSRYAKRFLHTAMVSFIIKEQIERSIADFRENGELDHVEQVIEQAFRIYCQAAPNQRQYEEIWRTLAQQFKKKYRSIMNYGEIQPSFLLSSLMFIINGDYDLSKLDKRRKLFQETRIINRGFLNKLVPKVKFYYRFTTQKVQNVMNFCRKPSNHLAQINKIVPLNNPDQLSFLLLQENSKKFYTYLSQYISPFNSRQYSKLFPFIYSSLNSEPPTLSSHQITLNYARHCLRSKKIEQYQKIIQKAMDITNYWLGQDHPLLCDIYESLSDYYGNKGNYQDSINFMKQALTTCIRSTGTHTTRAGNQYFKLAEKQWKFGQKKDAIQNYNKAKSNMESLNDENPSYPLLLNRMATAELNSGNLDKCILLAIKAIKASEQKSVNENNLIKIYEVLCRAYELNKNKQQLKNLAMLTAKVFNNSQNPINFVQMVRICLIGFTINVQPIKQQKIEEYMKNTLKNNPRMAQNSQNSVQRLMKLAENVVVMEKFMKGLQNIEKIINEGKLGRNQNFQSKQFRILFECILESVGVDFFQGVINQAKYW